MAINRYKHNFNQPLLVFDALTNTLSSAGIASQPIQITSGAYVSGNFGIANTNPTSVLHVTGNAIISGIVTCTDLNSVGIVSVSDTRLSSIADKTTIVVGNIVTLSYNTGGGNVAICSSPTGPITLNVTNIPTDSSFDNRAISFSVIVQQGATAYACTNVTLNGVAFSANAPVGVRTAISYPLGAVATGSTSGYDIFNFTGINTLGSASTTANYKIMGNVGGGYRLY